MASTDTDPPPVPAGFRLELDRSSRQLDAGTWLGGTPTRVVRLTPGGVRAWDRLRADGVTDPAGARLARRLTDAGLVHPLPPAVARPTGSVTVIVPVHDRAVELDRCLTALGHEPAVGAVIVVDDASSDAAAVAAVAARHGARLVRRPVNGGPGAARNTGLALAGTEFVALLDSDCRPTPGWLDRLVAHLADPAVAVVAPRIVPTAAPSWAGRYTRCRGALDLGHDAAPVRPGGRVGYVPTAALVARRAALAELGPPERTFDARLRVGEDVDLVWRLVAAGWRVRYQPEVVVEHADPHDWRSVLRRRYRYGTAAGPLARRHPAAIAPFVAHPPSLLAVAGLLTGRPALAGIGAATCLAGSARALHRAGLPWPATARPAVVLAGRSIGATGSGGGRYLVQFAAPVLAALAARGSTRSRTAATALALAPAAAAWWPRRRRLDPVRFVVGYLADELAYGTGVWAGAVRHRTLHPLRPVVRLATRSSRPRGTTR